MSIQSKSNIAAIFKVLKMCKLNSRLMETVLSMEKYFKENGHLTENQEKWLLDIYERA